MRPIPKAPGISWLTVKAIVATTDLRAVPVHWLYTYPDVVGYMYLKENSRLGLDPWAEIDGIDHMRDGTYIIEFGSTCEVSADAEYTVFISTKKDLTDMTSHSDKPYRGKRDPRKDTLKNEPELPENHTDGCAVKEDINPMHHRDERGGDSSAAMLYQERAWAAELNLRGTRNRLGILEAILSETQDALADAKNRNTELADANRELERERSELKDALLDAELTDRLTTVSDERDALVESVKRLEDHNEWLTKRLVHWRREYRDSNVDRNRLKTVLVSTANTCDALADAIKKVI